MSYFENSRYDGLCLIQINQWYQTICKNVNYAQHSSATNGSKQDLHYSPERSPCYRVRYQWNPWTSLSSMIPTPQLFAILYLRPIGFNPNSTKSFSGHKFPQIFKELGGEDLQTKPRKLYFFRIFALESQSNMVAKQPNGKWANISATLWVTFLRMHWTL